MPSNTDNSTKIIQCGVCLREFKTYKSLNQHTQKTLCGSKTFTCNKFEYAFDSNVMDVIEQAMRK